MEKNTLLKIVLIETLVIFFSPLLLKVTGQVDWSWWVACLPFIIPLLIPLLILFVILVLNIIYSVLEYVVEKMWVKLIKQFGYVYFDHRKLRNQLEKVQAIARHPLAGSIWSIPREFIVSDTSYLLNPLNAQSVEVMLVGNRLYDGGILVQKGKEKSLRKRIHSIRRFLNHGAVNYIVRRRILKTFS